MKIAFVSSGDSIHVKKIANALVNRGCEVTLYTKIDNVKLINDFDTKVKIVLLPFPGKLGYYLNVYFLRLRLIRGNYDLINSHFASGYGTLSRLTKVHPMVLAVFGSDVYEYPFKSKGNLDRIIKNLENADVITSTSQRMVEKVRCFFKTEKPIYVTPFGVDRNVFHPCVVDKKTDVFVFGTVKKIDPKYGIDILIKAYAQFYLDHIDCNTQLVIYGDGVALESYKKLASTLEAKNCIYFKGFLKNEDVPEALCAMDVACFPSRSESFGVAAVEAMACGIPLITSDAEGFKEVVEDKVTGFIVEKDNIIALVEAMKFMYRMTSTERELMGLRGVERVSKYYDFEDNVTTYVNAIKNAL